MNQTESGTGATQPESSQFQRVALFLFLVILGAGLDLWTKHAVFAWRGLPADQPPYWIIENFFGIETAINHGAVFGVGQGYGLFFAVVSIAAMVGILVWLFIFRASRSLWLTIAMGLVTGGIIGNLYDRLGWHGLKAPFAGGVRDWILFRFGSYTYPNFNIADSVLVAGAIMLAIHSFFAQPPSAST